MNYEKLHGLSDKQILAAGRRLHYASLAIVLLIVGLIAALALSAIVLGYLSPTLGVRMAHQLFLADGIFIVAIALFLIGYFTEFHGATEGALMPLAKNPRACLKAQELVEQHAPCRAIRDQVLALGRQLYVFDLQEMAKYVRGLEDKDAAQRAEGACRALHGIPEHVA
jgi:hypothetical protein